MEDKVEYMKRWYKKRVPAMYDMMADHFELNSPVTLTIDGYVDNDIDVSLNGFSLKREKFEGQWFPGRQITLKATRPEGKDPVNAWSVTTIDEDGSEYEIIYPASEFTQVFPAVAGVKIESITGYVAVDEIGMDPEGVAVEWYDLQGRSLGTRKPAPGVYIRKAGSRITKTIIR